MRPLTQYHLVAEALIVVSKNGEETFVKSGVAVSDGAAVSDVFQNISYPVASVDPLNVKLTPSDLVVVALKDVGLVRLEATEIDLALVLLDGSPCGSHFNIAV